MRLYQAMKAALTTFRKEILEPGSTKGSVDYFEEYEARMLRYRVLYAAYNLSLYDGSAASLGTTMPSLHPFSSKLKSDHGIGRWTKCLYSSFYRIAEIHATSLFGGPLDPYAGDGKTRPTCLPIETENEAIRPALAKMLRFSNFSSKKDVWCRNGAIFGDSPMRIMDDPEKKRVSISPVHPMHLESVTLDSYGNAKGYTISIEVADPRTKSQFAGRVKYSEVATRVNGQVRYETFLDNKPFPWNGQPESWTVPYDFIPLVTVKHIDSGLSIWGVSELSGAFKKILEIDDGASRIMEQMRVALEPTWFISGIQSRDHAAMAAQIAANTESTKSGTAGREEVLVIGARDPDARAQALVPNLNIGESSVHVERIYKSHIDDYPELRYDTTRARSDSSAKAIVEARKPAEAKLQMRRINYQDSLMRAIQMALSIGAIRGYPGFEAITPESYANGELDFVIAHRDIFDRDREDVLQALRLEAETIEAYQAAGVSPRRARELVGWTQQQIEDDIAAQPTPEPTPEGDATDDSDPRGDDAPGTGDPTP
jgi:hypothetical protein